jgi:hypothetical protein
MRAEEVVATMFVNSGASGTPGAGTPGAGPDEPPKQAKVLAVAAWLMLPLLIVSFGVGYALGVTFMGVLNVPAGGLLVHAGLSGRLAAVLVLVVGVLPVAAGVYLGRRAVREGAAGTAKAALVVNALVLTYLVVVHVVQQIVG